MTKSKNRKFLYSASQSSSETPQQIRNEVEKEKKRYIYFPRRLDNEDEAFTKFQIKFILRAIENRETLFDFENTTGKEFKECYGLSKRELNKELNKLKERF
jgi:hypothetical protein